MKNIENRLNALEKCTQVVPSIDPEDMRKEILSILIGDLTGVEETADSDWQTDELRRNLLERLS